MNKTCCYLHVLLPILCPGAAIPPLRIGPNNQDGWHCEVCVRCFGKVLIDYNKDAPWPDKNSGQKIKHDPWFCVNVIKKAREVMEAGDTRITPAMLTTLPQKPSSLEEFPALS